MTISLFCEIYFGKIQLCIITVLSLFRPLRSQYNRRDEINPTSDRRVPHKIILQCHFIQQTIYNVFFKHFSPFFRLKCYIFKTLTTKLKTHVDCSTYGGNTLDHCYSNFRDAYKALPRHPFGKSDHGAILHLAPTVL